MKGEGIQVYITIITDYNCRKKRNKIFFQTSKLSNFTNFTNTEITGSFFKVGLSYSFIAFESSNTPVGTCTVCERFAVFFTFTQSLSLSLLVGSW